MHDLPALAPRFRLIGALVAWGLLAAASPGVLTPDGSVALAVLGVAVWAHVEARPTKGRAWIGFAAHVLGAAPGAAATMLWIRFVYPPPLLYVGVGIACYSALGGVVLRRLCTALPRRAGSAPLAPLVIALAWTAQDVLRAIVPMPFGVEWLRTGHYAHAWLPLAASARVWGVSGLTFALASLAGGVAWAVRVVCTGSRSLTALWPGLASAVAPALLGLALGAATSVPKTVAGPRVLVVQPGFEQERKQLDDPRENFNALCAQTRAALAAEREAGNPEPDLVIWGESMLYLDLFEDGVRELAPARGAGGYGEGVVPDRGTLDAMAMVEEMQVRGALFGRGRFAPRAASPVLPAGSSLLAGAIDLVAHEGAIRRINAAVVYDAEARRSKPAAKRYLVPGAETMYGLERLGFVRRFIYDVASYVPDFIEGDETGVLPVVARDGRRYAIATTICFDNSHLAAYTDPVAAGDVDLHVVVSNEAWYRESFEVDQMVAFTRIAALASGRAIVRATNSGISLVMGPDGRELARITAAGRDRMVAGHLAVDVPVPAPGAGSAPPIARLRTALDGLWVGLTGVLALVGAARTRRGRAAERARSGPAGNPVADPG